jgi:hypothetical protein
MAYAWARIHLGGEGRKVVQPGTEVSEDDFADPADFDLLKREGAIKDEKYPENVQLGESPRTAMIRAANEAYENATQTPESQPLNEEEQNEEQGQRRESWRR